MAIREKPKPVTLPSPEAKALEFINKGGTVAGTGADKEKQAVNVKIPVDMLERIDAAVQKRAVPIYRVQWILEAVVEKLERDNA